MISNFDNFMYGDDYPITNITNSNDKIIFDVQSVYDKIKCPHCGVESHSIHTTHDRYVQDTPIHNTQTWIHIIVKEFECKNDKCRVKTFSENFPFVGKNQVMTYYLKLYIVSLSIYMSSNAVSLLLSFIGVNVSHDTVDNLLKKIVIKDDPDVEEIGIDDVALRKGIDYATAIYNLKTHQLIALLKGREKEDILPWLKAHPKIKVVARDRASAYASAITEVLPNAKQIADRFHLFKNLSEYLKELLYNIIPEKIVIKYGEITNLKAEKIISELTNVDQNIIYKMPVNNIDYEYIFAYIINKGYKLYSNYIYK